MKLLIICLFLFLPHAGLSQTINDKIRLINIEPKHRNRIKIARLLDLVNKSNPAVIGIDLQFSNYRSYDEDNALVSALLHCKNLVMIDIIPTYPGVVIVHPQTVYGSLPVFLINAEKGYANLILEEDECETLKRFSISENYLEKKEYHFGVKSQ
jgi:CHASE2 domain-containing sensor protein